MYSRSLTYIIPYPNTFNATKADREGGLPRVKKMTRSVDFEGVKSCKTGSYGCLQVADLGRLRFKDWRGVVDGSNVVNQVRLKQHPPGTGFDIQLVERRAVVSGVEESRNAINIGVGLKAIASLSNGKQNNPIVGARCANEKYCMPNAAVWHRGRRDM